MDFADIAFHQKEVSSAIEEANNKKIAKAEEAAKIKKEIEYIKAKDLKLRGNTIRRTEAAKIARKVENAREDIKLYNQKVQKYHKENHKKTLIHKPYEEMCTEPQESYFDWRTEEEKRKDTENAAATRIQNFIRIRQAKTLPKDNNYSTTIKELSNHYQSSSSSTPNYNQHSFSSPNHNSSQSSTYTPQPTSSNTNSTTQGYVDKLLNKM